MDTSSLLEQELAPLHARIEQVRGDLAGLEGQMAATAAELETFSADRQRFDLLREACSTLERLDQLQAGQLFWGDLPGGTNPGAHLAGLRIRIAGFDEKIGAVLDRQAQLKAQANRCLDELEYLDEEIHETYARDARREEEFAIEREISAVPHPAVVMPWHTDEGDRRYRFTLANAMSLSLVLGIVIHLVTVPVPVRPPVAQIPERLATMVRQERPKPEPARKAKAEEKKEEKKQAKADEKKQTAKAEEKPAQERPKAAVPDRTAAPKKAATAGVLAFKESFKDLMDDGPAPKLGVEARLSNTANQAGQALANRSLVAMQGGTGGSGSGSGSGVAGRNGGSGGIGNASVGRGGVGNGEGNSSRLGRGGAGVAKVTSNIGGPGGKDPRPLSSGARAARTDEEIQLLFDRYKSALYRIYNTELRKDPSLRGKMVLKLTIEPNGVVSACGVESTNMDAPGFSAQIVERVRKFNFGPKDGVPATTILYPIDFLPAR